MIEWMFRISIVVLASHFTLACTSRPKAPLVLNSDFGLKDGAVSAMKGVAYSVDSQLVISDLTHEITPYDISEGAFRLYQALPFWPQGTVFVVVVDPGVGSARNAIAARTRSGHYFIGPDN